MYGRMRRKIFDNLNHAYFVTFSCYKRRRLLDSDRAKGMVVHFLAAQLQRQEGRCFGYVIPSVAKVGGLQNQGAKGDAVVGYCDPLATPDLEPSGFPEG